MIDVDELGGPFKTVFDVGGNLGSFAEACWRRWRDAKIYSFEPLRDIAAENASRADGRWIVYPFAIAEQAGPAIINRNRRSAGASTLLEPGPIRRDAFGADDEYVPATVSVRTLDSFASLVRAPALLKIDVEGAELRVLEGGREILPLFDTVLLEVNVSPDCFLGSPTAGELNELMRELGFTFRGRIDQLRDPRDDAIVQFDGIWKR